MKDKKFWLAATCLFIMAITIHWFSDDSLRVQEVYTTGFYSFSGNILRTLFGWLPFSIGDILYGLAVAWFLWKLVKVISRILKRQMQIEIIIHRTKKVLIILLSLYILFNLLWGINYNSTGIAGQLGLKVAKYNTVELKELNQLLLEKVNVSKETLLQNGRPMASSSEIFKQSVKAYEEVKVHYPFLQYKNVSIKSSLWGWLGNYVGFTGYYNPFTGEAQVNTTVPVFLQPYTTCHEIAHQLGYAKENEANFVGYLAATASKDTFFHYSVYLDIFLYANRNLFFADSSSAKLYANQLSPAVKKDLKDWKDFNQRHKNPIEPIVRWMYGKYLQSNQQPTGVLSYDEVTAYLIAYHKKFGLL